VENFRTPNFPLVADALYWLVLRYDPNAKVPDDIDSVSHRVDFLTAAAATMASKGRIVLKTKNLYAADGRAVKELLKIAKVLYRCVCVWGWGGET
jgi:clusterin-associated protein 1